jgi:hypothetical protein
MSMRSRAACIPAMVCAVSFTLPCHAQEKTAWNDGYPRAGFKNADALAASIKAKAGNLGKDGKLRVLIIGDSLSEGHYHWSHYFRKNLQAAYGDGGYGAIWSGWAQYAGAIPGWLWDPQKDFSSQTKGEWRHSLSGRGDKWPYLGWNGNFLFTDMPDAEYQLKARGNKFTVVYSSGTYTTFNGRNVMNRAGGFTVRIDESSHDVPAAEMNAPLDMGILPYDVPEGEHRLTINRVHDGTLSLQGVMVESASPGVVVYNISHGGWWAHSYLWRQPGWEKFLAACKPDLTIVFLSKPESGGSTDVSDKRMTPEYEMLTQRVLAAIPRTQLIYFSCWEPRDGISPSDARTLADRLAWYEANKYPYLDLQHGLNPKTMKELGWFQDGIHLTPRGGKEIGDAISKLFLP